MRRRGFLKLMAAAAGASVVPRAFPSAAAADALDCISIGGGVSGLTAAWQLSERPVLLLEAEPRFGGRAISGNHGGWSYAKGTEYLGEPEGVFAEMRDELELPMVEIPAPMDMLYRDGSFHSGFAGRVRLLVRKGGLRTYNRFLRTLQGLAGDYAPPPEYGAEEILARLDAITCRQWFDEMDLPDIYYEMYDVMARGLFGANLDEVSALGAYEEIAYDFEGAEALEDMDDVDELRRESGPTGSFTFPRGIAEFTDAVGRDLEEMARAASRVTDVSGNDDEGYEVVYTDGSGGEVSLEAESVILATPLPVTLQIARSILSAEQADLIAQVPYAPYVTVAVFSDEPIFDRAFDLALPGDFFFSDFYDSTWVQRHVDDDADDTEGHVASFYVAPRSFRDRSLLEMTDEALLARCKADLERVLPGTADLITGHDVHRHPYAYPVDTPGQFGRLQRLHETLTGGLQLAGDGVVYPTFQTAILAGEIAADRIETFLD